jgi:tight adherence protein C
MALLGLAVACCWLAVRRTRDRRARRSTEAVLERLPVLFDLVGVCLAGGLTPGAAFGRVAEIGEPEEWWRDLSERLRNGTGLADAIELAGGPEHQAVRRALDPVVTAARSGGSVAAAVDRTVERLRGDLRRGREERARRLPVALLLPLTVCVLPAVMLIVVAPMVARVIGGT